MGSNDVRAPPALVEMDNSEQTHSMALLIGQLEHRLSLQLGAIEKKLGQLDSLAEKLDGLAASEGQRQEAEAGPHVVGRPSWVRRAPTSPRLRDLEDRQTSETSVTHGLSEFTGSPVLARSASSKSFLAMRAAMNVLGKNTARSYLAERVWFTMEPEAGSRSRSWFICIWPIIIMASVALSMVEEVMPVSWDAQHVVWIELAFDIVFTMELILRFLVCPDRKAYFFDPFNYIDFAAGVLPLSLRVAFLVLPIGAAKQRADLELIMICTTPALRLLKMLRRFEKFHLLLSAFKMALEALPVLLFTLMIIVFTFSAGIFWFEPRSNIESFPRAMWLTVVTMSTVGYGDITPKSVPGLLLVSILIIFSALYMAIPIGIVGSAFNRVWEDRDRLLLLHRMRTHLGQKGYDAMDIPELFFLFDEDKDGQLSFQEFHHMMAGLKLGINEERLVRLFHAFDNNGSGSVDDVEFVRRLFPQAFCHIYGPAESAVTPMGSSPEGTPARRRGVTNVGAFHKIATASGTNLAAPSSPTDIMGAPSFLSSQVPSSNSLPLGSPSEPEPSPVPSSSGLTAL